MLLATYALLTLTIEQQRERLSIQALQHALACPANLAQVNCAALSARSEALIRLAESRHQLRLENTLFPALRAASGDAALSLRALEELGWAGRKMLPRLRAVLRPAAVCSPHRSTRACRTVQAYCHNLLARLACEEALLLPLAQQLLSSDAWFAVGAEFLRQDAERRAHPARPWIAGALFKMPLP